jgi:ABC-type transport system substrate-binding protein
MTRPLSRRSLLRHASQVAALGAVVSLLEACGGSSAAPTATTGAAAAPTAPLVFPTQVPQPIQASAPSQATAAPQSAASPQAAARSTTAASSQTAPTTAASGAVKDVSFTVVDGSEPNSLDPPIGTGPFQHIINAMYEGLVAWDEKMQLQPMLATSWQPSADGKQWTFKLRGGVKFHDGTPFTSDAVKSTVDHILDKNTASTRRASYTMIQKVDTTDPSAVVITTDPANPDLPFLMADSSMRISSPTALQKFGKDFGRNPVGTGPYKFEEWVPNDHVSAVINPDYWGSKPQVRRYVFKPVPEASTRVVVLRTGEADVVMNLPPSDQDNLKQLTNVTLHNTPSLTVVMIELRVTKPPFSDKNVRYALNQAIDKDAIIKNVMRGQAIPLKTPGIEGIYGTADFDPLPFDPAKAKSLLAQAGFASGLDMTLFYVSGRWPGDDQVIQAVQGYWSQIGVRAKIVKGDNAALVDYLARDPDQNPGLAIMPQRSSFYLDYHLYRMYQTDATHANAAQRSGYSNPAVDALLKQEESDFDTNHRLATFQQAQKLIWDDQPFVYLFQTESFWGQQKSVSGFIVPPTGDLTPQQLQKG